MENITGKQVMYAILLWVLLENILEVYISLRQIRVYNNATSVPRELKNIMSEEQFHKARLYGLDRTWYAVTKTIFQEMLLLSFELFSGIIAHLWYMGVGLATYFRCDTTNEVAVSCCFFIILSLYSMIVELPFEYYATFTLEEKHGFNRQTKIYFVLDHMVGFFVLQLVSVPVVALTVSIVQTSGDYFFFWEWFITVVMALVLMSTYPLFIAPMQSAYKPLEDGPLKKSIEELAQSLGFPLENIYVVEGSRRSGHSNAYFFGMGSSKRIVIYDTLLLNRGKSDASTLPERERGRGCTNEEVLAVLAHELGHWNQGHFTILMVFKQVHLLLMLFAFQCVFQFGPFYEAFGFERGRKPIMVGLTVVVTYAMSPLNTLIGFGMKLLSRRLEYNADEFAHGLGYSIQLQKALTKLYMENLIFPEYDWLYSTWNHSHPTLMERLQRLKELDERRK